MAESLRATRWSPSAVSDQGDGVSSMSWDEMMAQDASTKNDDVSSMSWEEMMSPQVSPGEGAPSKFFRRIDHFVPKDGPVAPEAASLIDPSLSPGQKYQVARQLMQGASRHIFESRAIPFNIAPWMKRKAYRNIQEQLASGNERPEYYLFLAGQDELDSQYSKSSVLGKALRIAEGSIGFGGEFLATSGIGSVVGAAAKAKAAVGLYRAGASAGTALRAGQVAGGVARTLTQASLMPTHVAEEYEARRSAGEAPASAFIRSASGQLIEVATELYGGEAANKVLGSAGKLLASTKMGEVIQDFVRRSWIGSMPWRTPEAFRSFLQKAGYHGPIAELIEERESDLAKGLLGLEPDYGTLGDLLQGKWSGVEQLSAELLAFSFPQVASTISGQAVGRVVKWRADRSQKKVRAFFDSSMPEDGIPPDSSQVPLDSPQVPPDSSHPGSDLPLPEEGQSSGPKSLDAAEFINEHPDEAKKIAQEWMDSGRSPGAKSLESMGFDPGNRKSRNEFSMQVATHLKVAPSVENADSISRREMSSRERKKMDWAQKAQAESDQENARIDESSAVSNPSDGLPPVVMSPANTSIEELSEGFPKQMDSPSGKRVVTFNKGQVITGLEEVVVAYTNRDVPVRVGRNRVLARSASGIFNTFSWVIGLRKADNISTATHEVAHAIDFSVFGGQKEGQKAWSAMSSDMKKELVDLGKELYGDTKPAAGYIREGFAEFLRYYMTNPSVAVQKAPKFHEWFEKDFRDKSEKGWKQLQSARKMIKDWAEAGSDARTSAQFIDTGSVRYWIMRHARKDLISRLSQMFFDRGNVLRSMMEMVSEVKGRELVGEENVSETWSALRKVADGRVRWMVKHGMMDLAGNIVSGFNSLEEAFAIAAKHGGYENFRNYLGACRTLSLAGENPFQEGKDVGKIRATGIELDDARHLFSKHDSPQFRLAADMVYRWQDGILEYCAQCSPLIADVVKRIRENDPGCYVPMERVFREFDPMSSPSGRNAQSGQIAKRMRGSGRPMKDLLPTIIKNAVGMVNTAHERMVMDQVLHYANTVPGLGVLVQKVDRPQEVKYRERAAEILKRMGIVDLEGGNIEPDQDVIDFLEKRGLDYDKLNEDVMLFFGPADKVFGPDPVVAFREPSGSIGFYYLNERVFDFFARTPPMSLPYGVGAVVGVVGNGFRLLKNLFTVGMTGLRAKFSLIRNTFLDTPGFLIRTERDASIPSNLMFWVSALGESFVGTLKDSAFGSKIAGIESFDTHFFDLWKRWGGQISSPLREGMSSLRQLARHVARGGVYRFSAPHDFIDFLADMIQEYADLIQFPENAPRVAEIRAVAKRIGYDPSNPITVDQMIQMLNAGKQITIDFTQAGTFAEWMNQFVPFFNSTLQGPVASYRALKKNPEQFVRRSMALASVTAALWFRNKDDDWYKQAGIEKYRYYLIRIRNPFNGQEELLTIPRDYEEGFFFGTVLEGLLNSAYEQDPKHAEMVARMLIDKYPVTPDKYTPEVVQEVLEQAMNYDTFRHAPIVPEEKVKAPKEAQYTRYTSETAKFFANKAKDLFGHTISPARAEHAVQSIFGATSKDTLDSLDMMFGLKERAMREPADLPVLGTLFRRGGPMGIRPEVFDKVYDAWHKAVELQHDPRHKETSAERTRRLILDDAAASITALQQARIEYDSAKDQRDAVSLAVKQSKEVLSQLESGNLSREPSHRYRKRAEQLKENAKQKK